MIKNIKKQRLLAGALSVANNLIEAFNIWWERRKVLKDMERRDYSVI